ncbi:AAA family ATPase [bacterium]|nr:AAA family ATPase [bacterium]
MVQQSTNEFQILLKALGYLRTHGWLLLIEVALIYGYSLQRYFRAVPEYNSTAAILIDHSQDNLYKNYMMSSSRQANARKQNMAQLLTSHEVMERLRSSLTDIYNNNGRPSYLGGFFPDGVAISANMLRNHVVLTWDKTSDIFNMTCTATHPDAAHDLCLAYMNTTEAYYPEVGQRDAIMKREFLSRQLSTLSRQIAEYEVNLVEYQKKDPELSAFLMVAEDDIGRQKLQNELAKTEDEIRTNRATKGLLLKVPQAKRGEHTSLQMSIEASTAKVADLEYRLRLTEESNDTGKETRIQALRAELKDTSAQLAKLNEQFEKAFLSNPVDSNDVRTRLAKLELEYRVLQIQSRSINGQMEKINSLEKKFVQQRLEYKRIKADLEHKRNLLKNLYKLEQETELELSAGVAEIYRLREPSRNPGRVSPQLSKYLYGSLSISLFILAMTLILLMAAFPRIDNESEVNRLNLPVIGKVPHIRQTARVVEDIPSYAVEYLKIMNYRILRETKDQRCPVVIVTSAQAREGKSTVVNSLTLAAHDPTRRALLIDGDLLTNRPNEFFGVTENKTEGLYSLLHGAPSEPLIVPTRVDGLSFLPRGQRLMHGENGNVQKPLELALNDLRKQYDVIFIDTPPLFTSNLAHQWAALADLIVVVARIFVTRPRDVIEAIQTCKLYSRAPIGVALNCVPLTGAYRRASNYYFSKKKTRSSIAAA